MRRVLLTGAAGQLGTDVRLAAPDYSTIELHAIDREELDITDPSATSALISDIEPDVIIHAAAYTAVDDCESNSEAAHDVNAGGTAAITSAAKAIGARVIYVSTDSVSYTHLTLPTTPYV